MLNTIMYAYYLCSAGEIQHKDHLYDGFSQDEEAGGFVVPASTSYKINFLIVHPSAVIGVAKHVLPRIFSPQQYQQADAWKFDYRIYHDVFVKENKVKGIYLHRATTANQ